jgi:hypothetical protein
VGRRIGLLPALVLLAALVSSAARAGSPVLGCAGATPGRVAVAYDATGHALQPQPVGAPAPCLVATGYATVETHLAVTGDGTLVYEPAVVTPGLLGTPLVPGAPGPRMWSPASPGGLAVSADRGATWRFVAPAGATYSPTDNAMYADPATGRLFLAMLAPDSPTGGQVPPQDQPILTHEITLTSDDDGRTWGNSSLPGFVASENPRFTSAPPPAGGVRPAGGYPDLTYWCGNREVGLAEPLILERECYRSIDAGTTWEMRSIVLSNPVPRHPECGASREDLSPLDGDYAEGAPDGSLYLIVGCTPETAPFGHDAVDYLARSTDEAASFPVLHGRDGKPLTLPVPAGLDYPELRVAGDTLVLVYSVTSGDRRVLMRTAAIPGFTSKGAVSGPLSWSPPVRLTPPGLSSIDKWAVDVRGRELALSYLASSHRPGSKAAVWDGYLSEVTDVAHPQPVWMGMVNDPARPLSFNNPEGGKDDFIGVTIGPDGRPWASYFAPCSADPSAGTDPACQANSAFIEGGEDRGVVGSLVFPGGG